MKEPNGKQFFMYTLFAVVVLLIARFIFTGKIEFILGALRPFIFASIFIYFFSPIAGFIQKKTKFSRKMSIILSYILFLMVISLFISMILPSVIDSIQMLIQNVTSYNEREFILFVQSIPLISLFVDTSSLGDLLNALEGYFVDYSSNILDYSTDILSSIGSFLKSLIFFLFALVMSFYALKDTENIAQHVEEFIKAFFTEKIANQIIRIAKLIDQSLKKFLIGKLYTCVILGAIVGLSITIINIVTPLHIPYAPLIAIIIGISNLIPYVGSFLGTVPCVLMALFSGFWEAIVLLLIVIVAQQIDNIIITPKIIGDSVGLKPFWVIVAVTVGGGLFGPIGMIVAVPFVSVLLYLADERVEQYKANHQDEKV